jgi:hypothetical protein
MKRIRYIVPLICVVAPIGCHRANSTESPTAPAASQLSPQQMAKKTLPVLSRTLTQQELDQLYKYMTQYQADHGKYPASMNDLKELSVPRDLPNVAHAVESGDLVLAGGAGGVLAYEKAALEDRGSVLTTNGVQTMTAGELKKLLGR